LGGLGLAVTLYMHRTPHVWLGVGVIGIVTGVLLARYEDDPGWVWALVLARYLLAPRRFIAPLILDDEVSLHAYVHDPALSHSSDWWWPLPARSRSLSGGGV
ncbi:MAG: hypothetical protein M1516_00520, partial [Firmicutes bacterium]|nr:hypothetical protein [Bacillota bacterium]